MTDPHNEGKYFRPSIGVLCIVGGLAGFFALYFIEVPTGNRDAMMLALGIVLGWASAVVQSEYGSTSTGRKVTDSAIRNIERQQVATTGAPPPADAIEAAQDVADAGQNKADAIKGDA